ncbi:MAG: cobalt transporter CbiM [Parafannyhessea sp.]|uniref:cobalt transporter CbiM n=1 Tax=Parafannyhessea sp. TaxID=2847324 RepID=UPI003F046C6C
MHIPENYLSPSTCGVFAVAMVPIWMRAVRHVREEVPRQKMPLVGVAAAFCFLAMMFNIPLPGGTTGHAVAGTLVAILFGPWAATLAISIALAIQAVMFGDGGILALPANCFNMAFVLPMCGYAVYGLVRGQEGRHAGSKAGSGRPGLGRELAAAGVGSYVGINAAALCAAIEFGVQPLLFSDAAGRALYCPYPLWVSVPAMLVGHLTVWGAAEVVFTVGILAFVRRVAPGFGLGGLAGDGVQAAPVRAARPVLALVAALAVLTPLGLLATGDAWGEWSTADLAAQVGYTPAGMAHGWEWASLMPDYSLGALPSWLGYVLSAAIGVGALLVAFRLLGAGASSRVDFGPRHDG